MAISTGRPRLLECCLGILANIECCLGILANTGKAAGVKHEVACKQVTMKVAARRACLTTPWLAASGRVLANFLLNRKSAAPGTMSLLQPVANGGYAGCSPGWAVKQAAICLQAMKVLTYALLRAVCRLQPQSQTVKPLAYCEMANTLLHAECRASSSPKIEL
eukprot:scaffold80438_cov20-Tisochrysis_lutea.AAC.1